MIISKYVKTSVSILLAGGLLLSSCSTSLLNKNIDNSVLSDKWQPLLKQDLSGWEVWMGIPHDSVKGLPAGTHTASNLNVHGDTKDTMGLNNDVKNVFKMIEQDGQPVLHISGEIYGGISTKASYQNYHLSFQVKWGDKKWAPRLNALRDSGLLFHCYGEHGGFWQVWKLCQEFQVQETDLGDYIPLGNGKAKLKGKIRHRKPAEGNRVIFDSKGKLGNVGYASAYPEVDKPHGEWNTLELFAFADKAVFMANGVVVMVVQDLLDGEDKAMVSGQLQFQSEGAELFYRDIKIKGIKQMPEQYASYFDN